MNGGRYPNILQHMTKVRVEQKSWKQLHLAEGAQELLASQKVRLEMTHEI